MVSLSYGYTITYKNGLERNVGGSQWMIVNVQEEDYLKIVEGIAGSLDLMEIPRIEHIREQMIKDVLWDDSWHNTNGTKRNSKLKKPREYQKIVMFPGAENHPAYPQHEKPNGRDDQAGAENDSLPIRWLFCYNLLQKRNRSL